MSRHTFAILSASIAATLACGGLGGDNASTGGDNDCGVLALSETDVTALLTAWEGRYTIADYCAVGDCPPNEQADTTMVVDPSRTVIEWVRGQESIRSVDLKANCISGMTGTAGTGLGSTTLMMGKIPAQEMIINLERRDQGGPGYATLLININWPDPEETQNIMLPGTRVWSGSAFIEGDALRDYPSSAGAEGRLRTSSAETRADIWLKPTVLPGAGRIDNGG